MYDIFVGASVLENTPGDTVRNCMFPVSLHPAEMGAPASCPEVSATSVYVNQVGPVPGNSRAAQLVLLDLYIASTPLYIAVCYLGYMGTLK